ncbi:MAG: hypothetical protein HQ581_02370 [Planctomycetes bacterium]|nr:hypothetical protein [Planctomycetota bacterium]
MMIQKLVVFVLCQAAWLPFGATARGQKPPESAVRYPVKIECRGLHRMVGLEVNRALIDVPPGHAVHALYEFRRNGKPWLVSGCEATPCQKRAVVEVYGGTVDPGTFTCSATFTKRVVCNARTEIIRIPPSSTLGQVSYLLPGGLENGLVAGKEYQLLSYRESAPDAKYLTGVVHVRSDKVSKEELDRVLRDSGFGDGLTKQQGEMLEFQTSVAALPKIEAILRGADIPVEDSSLQLIPDPKIEGPLTYEFRIVFKVKPMTTAEHRAFGNAPFIGLYNYPIDLWNDEDPLGTVEKQRKLVPAPETPGQTSLLWDVPETNIERVLLQKSSVFVEE